MTATLEAVLLAAASRHKTNLWLVGGPVRDQLLAKPYDDWDLVCRKAGAVARAAAKKLKAKFIVLDEQHRIYRVILPETFRPAHTLDFAELQGRTIEEDLSRRDFSINAMARPLTRPTAPSPDGRGVTQPWVREIVDPFHGQRDLKKKIIRAVSEKAFTEDPLRLLRAFRFQAQLQFRLEARTRLWVRKHAQRIGDVSPERIREELLRLWKSPAAAFSIRDMDAVGLLTPLFAEIESCRRTAVRYYGKGGVLKHSFETVENLEWILEKIEGTSEGVKERTTRHSNHSLFPSFSPSLRTYLKESVGGYPRYAWLKWAAFLHDFGKPATAKMIKGRLRFYEHEHIGAALATQIGERFRCSRRESQLLGTWVRNHMRLGNLAAASRITDRAVSRFFRDLGVEGIGMVLVSLADHYTYLARRLWGKGKDPVDKMALRLFTSYFEERARILPPKLIDGHELMRYLRIKPGPRVGKLLSVIQDAQADGKVKTREEAFAFAKSRAGSLQKRL